MILYHGSNSLFSNFSLEFIGENAGYTEGAGVYFTTSLEIASRYGKYLYMVEFSPRRELSDTELTITSEEYYLIIETMHTHYDYLENYGEPGYDGLSNLKKRAYDSEYAISSSDSELLAGIGNGNGNHQEVLKIAIDILNATHFKGFNFEVDIYSIFDLTSFTIIDIIKKGE